MTRDDMAFLFETLASTTERGFIAALHKDPKDEVSRGAYADFLEENGRQLASKMVREGWTPGEYARTYPKPPISSYASGAIVHSGFSLFPYS